MMVRLDTLPQSDALLRSKLLGAKYRFIGTKTFKQVTTSCKIAKVCYNDLKPVWTDGIEWYIEVPTFENPPASDDQQRRNS